MAVTLRVCLQYPLHMTPGERITLIRESGRLLEPLEWREIDLVLSQHKLPISEFSSGGAGDKYGYVLEMIGEADEDALRALHTYLVGESEDVPEEAQPWTPGYLKLFMSHIAIHQTFVGQIGAHLSGDGISAFVAHTSIDPSKEWMDVIETALRTADAMVVFLHPGFHESNWCDQEVGFALAKRLPVFIVAIDNMLPYGFMGKFQALKLSGSTVPPVLASQIRDWLGKTSTAQEALVEGLVTAFEHSHSYDQTRRLFSALQSASRFTPKQLERMDEASRTNSQIVDATVSYRGPSVPSEVRALIARHGGITPSAEPSPDPWDTGVPPSRASYSDEPPF